MTNFRNFVAASATLALVAVGQNAFAQDDLDDLLKDLEADTSEPAAVEPAKAEPAPAAEEPAPAVEEPAAEEPAPAVEQPAAEEPAPAAEEPAPAVEEPAAEEPAPAAEEPAPAADAPAADENSDEDSDEGATESVAATPEESAEAAKKQADDLAELRDNLVTTERLRRKAFDAQASREIVLARECMTSGEYLEAAKHFRIAQKLLNDSPNSQDMRKECDVGVADGLYRAALQEEATGRRDRAIKLMEKAVDRRHPKARRQLEAWLASDDPEANKADISEIIGRRNETEFKSTRTKVTQHLKRARQRLGTKELDKALDECELVLTIDPYNQEAIRLREKIERKMHTIVSQERKAAREGMIADVDKAWRPVYAIDAQDVERKKGDTLKVPTYDDPERRQEQSILKRMREMHLPEISFKPPATIYDAVQFFIGASKEYDRPELPLDERGFGFQLISPQQLAASGGEEEEETDGFGGSSAEGEGDAKGAKVIPTISVTNPTFFDALTLVCESVGYKFKVKNGIVVVMPKDMVTEDMVTRSYPVLSTFMERMNTASSDLKEMKGQGFGGASSKRDDSGEENQERDWKAFFGELGVQWPEGSSIMYIKTIGKLRVKNTYENLAELEKALTEMNADPKLIEIEARFVEVCQEDLNSLGFEWILNSDYSLGLGKHIGHALGLRNGAWGKSEGTTAITTSTSSETASTSVGGVSLPGGTTVASTAGSSTTTTTTDSRTYYANSSGASWIKKHGAGRMGVNSFGGDSDFSSGQRYLSTLSNHISGESKSTNDQFMRVNAFLGGADLSMILHMLSQRSDTDLLSAPKVLTRPGEEAVMKVVTEYIYPTDYDVQLQSSNSGGGNNNSSQSAILAVVEPQGFTMREVGVILITTPTLTDDGNLIDLKIEAHVVDEPTWKNYGMRIPFTGNSSQMQNFLGIGDILGGLADVLNVLGTGLSDSVKANFAESAVSSASAALDNLTRSSADNMTYYDAPMEQPFFHVRTLMSSVSVYPGATIVMGGLITEQRKAMDDKIPFLGDLPFIGRLFRSHSEQTNKRNLLIFVTTRLVDVRGREVTLSSGEQRDELNVTASPNEAN